MGGKYGAEYYHVQFQRKRGPMVVATIIGALIAVVGFAVGFGLVSLVLGFVGAGVAYSLVGR